MASWCATGVLLMFVIATAVPQQNNAYSDFDQSHNEVGFYLNLHIHHWWPLLRPAFACLLSIIIFVHQIHDRNMRLKRKIRIKIITRWKLL